MNIEGLDYNTQREQLVLPEYGREIQSMVNYAIGLTDREERAIDTMIVCSAAEPQKHIVVEGGHNGSRVVHDYTVRNGGKQLAAYTDAETTDANGKPVRTEKGTTAWTALKGDMLEASGMDKDAVLTFRSQDEYEQYLADTEMLKEADFSSEDTGNSNYFMPDELRRKFKKFKDYDHRCEKCHGKLKIVVGKGYDKLKCPRCKYKLIPGDIIMWD